MACLEKCLADFVPELFRWGEKTDDAVSEYENLSCGMLPVGEEQLLKQTLEMCIRDRLYPDRCLRSRAFGKRNKISA